MKKTKVSVVFDTRCEDADGIALAVKKFVETNYKANRVQIFFREISVNEG